MSDTNIPVSNEMWAYLRDQKSRGDSFDDVLRVETDFEQREDHHSRTPSECPVCGDELDDVDLPRHFRNGCSEVEA